MMHYTTKEKWVVIFIVAIIALALAAIFMAGIALGTQMGFKEGAEWKSADMPVCPPPDIVTVTIRTYYDKDPPKDRQYIIENSSHWIWDLYPPAEGRRTLFSVERNGAT